MQNKLAKFAITLCFLLSISRGYAQDEGTDPSVSVLKDIQNFVVQRDGSFVMVQESLTQLNEDRAVRSDAQRSFTFNRTMQDVEILEAYTEKPDGRRIEVKPEEIKLQQAYQSAGAPMFQDLQVKTIVFPDVAVGDKLYSRARTTQRTAVFPGQFSDATPSTFRPTTELRLTYDLPADMPLKSSAKGFKALPSRSADGRTVYSWEYIPAPNARIEAGAVDYWDFGRALLVSTFNSFADVGRAYDQGASGKAQPDAAIRALTDKLTHGLSDQRAKALAITNWIRKNIRYVAVYIGNGAMVPHDAPTVLTNLYGDCKDHATLLEAMLGAAGIDSTPALINSGDSYALPPVASLGQIDHVITYIPRLDLYLDSTAEDVEAGYLPLGDLGKPVILTRTGEIGHTPSSQPGQISNHFRVRIAADGSADFSFTRDNLGFYEETTRWEQRNWKKTDQALAVENILKARGVTGKGEVQLGDLDATSQGYSFTLRGHAENWTYLPGTVGISTDSSLYAGLSPIVFALTAEKVRTQPFVCAAYDVVEEAVFDFTPGATVLALPPDVNVASPYFQYRANYRREGQSVRVERRFKSGKTGTRVCTATDFAAMQPDITRMVRDLRTQFILQVLDLH